MKIHSTTPRLWKLAGALAVSLSLSLSLCTTVAAAERPSLSGLQQALEDMQSGWTAMTPRVGESSAECVASTEGLLRWSASAGRLEVCDGAEWSALALGSDAPSGLDETCAMICTLSDQAGVPKAQQPSYCRFAGDRYVPMGTNGEIIKDRVTGLEWQRCSVG